MTLDPLLTQQVQQRTEDCYRMAERVLERPFPRPEIRFDQRGQAAGSAQVANNLLRFNPQLIQQHPQAFIEQVVPHEVAHLVVWHCFCGAGGRQRIRPHGAEWQHVMEQIFGVPAKRTHDFEVQPARQLKRYAYRCGCQHHALTSIRHKRAQAGQRYICRACGQALVAA